MSHFSDLICHIVDLVQSLLMTLAINYFNCLPGCESYKVGRHW